MRRLQHILAVAAVLLSLIWITACVGGKEAGSATEEFPTVSTEGAASGEKEETEETNDTLAGDNENIEEGSPQEQSAASVRLREGLNVVYTENDGLYLASEGEDMPAPIKIAEGKGIDAPNFSKDGNSVAYICDGDLYGYSFSARKTELLLKKVISYCPDEEAGFLASSKETGIIQAKVGQEAQVIWKPGAVTGGWVQCEKLTLSPNGKLLAFDQRKYVDQRESADTSLFDQNMGIWLYERDGQTAVPIQIDEGELPFFERLNQTGGSVYPDAWPAKWSPDSTKLLIWRDVRSGSLRADGIPASIYDVTEKKMEYLYIDKDNEEWQMDSVLLPYNENITFMKDGSLAALAGGGREMALNKSLVKITLGPSIAYEPLATPGLIPQSPQAAINIDGMESSDHTIYFAASKQLEEGEEVAYPIWRQLYKLENGTVSQLTTTDADSYSSESPILAQDGETLVFGRLDENSNLSIWKIGTDGNGLQKLADLKQNANTPEPEEGKESETYAANYKDFYGRGSWNDMMAVYVKH